MRSSKTSDIIAVILLIFLVGSFIGINITNKKKTNNRLNHTRDNLFKDEIVEIVDHSEMGREQTIKSSNGEYYKVKLDEIDDNVFSSEVTKIEIDNN